MIAAKSGDWFVALPPATQVAIVIGATVVICFILWLFFQDD